MELSIHQGIKGIVIEEKKEMLSIIKDFYGGTLNKENSLELLKDAHELSVSKITEWISRGDKVLYTAFEWLLSESEKQSREFVETISDYKTEKLAEFIYEKKREDYKIFGFFYCVPPFVKHESFMYAKKLMETLIGIYELDDTYKQYIRDVGMTYESTINNTRADVQNNVAEKNNSEQVEKKIDEILSIIKTKTFSSKIRAVIDHYPRFEDDYQTLINMGYMCEGDNGCLKWLKTNICLALYFDSIKKAGNHTWKVVEQLFEVDNLKNSLQIGKSSVQAEFEELEKSIGKLDT